MRIAENKIYFSYVLLGALYFVSKAFYYIFDFVCLSGLMLGLIATIGTILIGAAAFKEHRKGDKHLVHWLALIGPLIILLYSPLHMVVRLGLPIFQFPIEKFTILLIFECLAIAQITLAVLMFKGLKVKT